MEQLLVADWVRLSRQLSKSSKGSKPLEKRSGGGDEDAEDDGGLYEGECMDDGDVEIMKGKKLWEKYLDHAFISTGYQKFEFAKE
ncbi:unnamed protein product [Ambrosiozyma monospora]|uniref:Unnamed protein product n=1 Tax=Ambrosiozyma monospora TaxID=43982 RepID=A0ACB5T3N5_AMBMO|nr:unnamed protein product [Ambrosiozyma monospora]